MVVVNKMPNEQNNLDQKYKEVYNEFINSDEDTKYSKTDVKQIIEAHKYKEFMENYKQRTKKRNLVLRTHGLVKPGIHRGMVFQVMLTYLFYVGTLILITTYIYPGLMEQKATVFLMALAFTFLDQVVKPLIFFFDLISFTIHKIGLLSLGLFTLVFYILSNILEHDKIAFEQAIVVAVMVMFVTFVVDLLNRQPLFKQNTQELVDEIGSEEDE